SSNLFVWLSLFVTLIGIAKLVSKFGVGGASDGWLKILYYTIGTLFLLFLTDVTNALTMEMGVNTRYLFVSVVWVTYSISIILFGMLKSIKKARLAGIALLFLTLLKVIFFDLPAVSIFIKAVLFIGLGFVG